MSGRVRRRRSVYAVVAVVVAIARPGVAWAAAATTLPERPATVMPCTNIVSTLAQPPSGYESIGGQVALPTKKVFGRGVLEPGSDGFRFAKQGLVVKTGGSAELIVPPAWEQRLNIAWGDTTRTTDLQITNCGTNPQINWNVFAGGFYVKQRGCVPLIVRANGREYKVHIAVGARCS